MTVTAETGALTRPPSRTQHHRTVKRELSETPHPAWVEEMIADLKPDWDGVLASPVFAGTVTGGVSDETWKAVVKEFFCVVEAFPKYMGVYLGRTTYGKHPGDLLARDWLIGNIRTEALHAQWFIDWGVSLGLTEDEIIDHRPGPEVASLYEFLWSVSYRGSLAEAFGAVNYAIEGTTGDWTEAVMPAFKERLGEDKRGLMWLAEHAEYDDAHPREALELIKLTVRDEDDRAAAKEATRRSLELFRRAFDACLR
ncbi:iron-containing redox enzyme family protein [Actinocorallia sp. API 0066]|uniref:TenA family transcriptional regulator n=1 Tax=Actinocorallia sp. API 0066 TaxID=2896846 RepID=UPI001E29180D|nr:iron-containing redox enzyme family protein [Actinocorallia sp. API 0066]MCD0451460.1 iron-containing redox enzyme family protein [Actinocorallia sp. API 0066]